MAYTLAQYARLATDNKIKAGVIDILRANSPLMEAIVWENYPHLDAESIRTKSLPSVASRKIGGSWTHSQGEVEPVTDRIVNIGGKCDIDKLLARAETITNQKALQVSMYTKAVALHFNNKFITGAPSVDYDDLTGIWYRLVNQLPADQTIAGGGLDVSPDASSLSTNQKVLINHIHDLCDRGDQPDFLVCNREMKLRLNAALRESGLVDTTQDTYGRTFETFGPGGPKVLDIGPTDPLDRTARIIGNLEADNGNTLTGGDATTIFAVKFNAEYLIGWNVYALDVQDMGLLEDGVTERVVIDWPLGIQVISPFSLARLVGIVAA